MAIALASESTASISIGQAYIMDVQHKKTCMLKQETELTQISAKANEEALFEVLTVYPGFYQNVLYIIQLVTFKSVITNMPITGPKDLQKSSPPYRHRERITTICNTIVTRRMFPTGLFNKMLPVSKSSLLSTLDEIQDIIHANHKGWSIANLPLFPKILNGKLQIGISRWLNIGTLYAKIKGKNRVAFSYLTVK
jgi:hypothetical protein